MPVSRACITLERERFQQAVGPTHLRPDVNDEDYDESTDLFCYPNAYLGGPYIPYTCLSCKNVVEWDSTVPRFRGKYNTSVANWKVIILMGKFRLHCDYCFNFGYQSPIDDVFKLLKNPNHPSQIVRAKKSSKECDPDTMLNLLQEMEELLKGWPKNMEDKKYFLQLFQKAADLNACLGMCDAGFFNWYFCPVSDSGFHNRGREDKKRKKFSEEVMSESGPAILFKPDESFKLITEE